MILTNIFHRIKRKISKRSSASYISYLREIGVSIGDDTYILSPSTFTIDEHRASLISIGNNVRFNVNNTILCHDAAAKVFRSVYNDYLPSNGHVLIGNNVWFGRNCTVLKGVTIGDNCIIGFGSTVMHDIPSNSVAAGTPAKVICTLDDYYQKRKKIALEESFEYARSIQIRYNRRPVPEDFFESFVYFVNGNQINEYPNLPIKYQLGDAYDEWKINHKARFSSFDDFLKAAGL